MNSVAPIASNRVYVRGKYFNCSNFICKERSQWRLESRRSPFFPFFSVFVCFVVVVVFFINHNYFPLACFPLFSLLTLYQPRSQCFSLKKWVGREKALASAGQVDSLNIPEKLIYMQPAGFALTEVKRSNNGK